MANKDEKDWRPALSDEGRRLRRLLIDAIRHEWQDVSGIRTLHLFHPLRLGEFCEVMMLRGDTGYETGAQYFMAAVIDGNLERAVVSQVLTNMAWSARNLVAPWQNGQVLEAQVAVLGRFLGHMLGVMPARVCEWCEDMEVDAPERGASHQPTALIRGVLLAPSLDQRKFGEFWDMAAASSSFPIRIFSDPCHPREGAMFSSYHLRAFGQVFSAVSSAALTRLVTHMRDHARDKMQANVIGDGKWEHVLVPATEGDRSITFESIIGSVEPNDRKKEVAALLSAA